MHTHFATLSLRALSLSAAASLALIAGLAQAQATSPNPAVLKGQAVTEGNLVDALTPPDGVVTRSLKVDRKSTRLNPVTATSRMPSSA